MLPMEVSIYYFFTLGLLTTVTGHRISSRCVDVCKEESSIKCERPCYLNMSVLFSLRSIYGRYTVDACVTPCRCNELDYGYASNEFCKVVQSFAMAQDGSKCRCMHGLWSKNLAKLKIQTPESFDGKNLTDYTVTQTSRKVPRHVMIYNVTSSNRWENWCKHQCANGMGGSACYCDIIP